MGLSILHFNLLRKIRKEKKLDTILFVAFLSGMVSVFFIYIAERYYRKHSVELKTSQERERVSDIYFNVYSGGLTFAIFTILIVIFGGVFFFIKDFEAESFKDDLLLLASMIFLLFGALKVSRADSYQEEKDFDRTIHKKMMYEGLAFVYVGIFFIVTTFVLDLLSIFN